MLPRRLRLSEQIDVVHPDERPLGHHGHGVDCVGQRLRRAVRRGKAVAVELARRAVNELFGDEVHIVITQKGLFAADDIESSQRTVFEVRLEAPQRLARVFVERLSCHLLTP